MTIPEIIAALTPYTGRFPKEAVQEAIAQREAITPHLLEAMAQVANAPVDDGAFFMKASTRPQGPALGRSHVDRGTCPAA